HRPALEALALAAERAEDRDTLLSMHARLASGATDASIAAHHRIRLGEILLGAKDAAGALDAFRAALALDAQSLSATRGLSRAARAARDPVALGQAARYETHVTRDRDAAVALLLDAARLLYRTDREADAATMYEEALTLD